MNSGERKVLAMIGHVLIQRIGYRKGGSFSGGLKTITKSGEIPAEDKTIIYRIGNISWSSIDIYDETNSIRTYNAKVMGESDIVLKTQERESYEIFITKVYSSLIEGRMENYIFTIEFPSWNEVKIRDMMYPQEFVYIIDSA